MRTQAILLGPQRGAGQAPAVLLDVPARGQASRTRGLVVRRGTTNDSRNQRRTRFNEVGSGRARSAVIRPMVAFG